MYKPAWFVAVVGFAALVGFYSPNGYSKLAQRQQGMVKGIMVAGMAVAAVCICAVRPVGSIIAYTL